MQLDDGTWLTSASQVPIEVTLADAKDRIKPGAELRFRRGSGGIPSMKKWEKDRHCRRAIVDRSGTAG